MPNWKDFCNDDNEEINTGSTMSQKEADRIMKRSNYAHYWLPVDRYGRVLKSKR